MTVLSQDTGMPGGSLILVNRTYAYDGPDIGTRMQAQEGIRLWGSRDVRLQKCAADALCALMEEIGGWQQIVPVSGWRSRQEQQQIWDDSLAAHGRAFTETYVAYPGHSEHQTGLAIDLGICREPIDFIRPDFPYDGICGQFRKRAAAYGFVERYPKGKEAVTGIGYEPWHFRYVGVPHAAAMDALGMVLEEYIAYLYTDGHIDAEWGHMHA